MCIHIDRMSVVCPVIHIAIVTCRLEVTLDGAVVQLVQLPRQYGVKRAIKIRYVFFCKE